MDLDAHLVAIAAGDPDAFARWVAGAEPRVRASLSSFADRVDVEAVLQECLLRVWQVAPRVVPDGRPEALLRLAVRIGRNLAVDELRRRRILPSDDVVPEPSAWPPAPDPMLREVIARCRQDLPEKPALALGARLRDGASAPDRDLAQALGMKLNTFLQNFSRARRLLAECLRRAGVDLESESA
jgi:DNA-directed RNA polymerase specialized sigma24 family protein